MVTKVSNDTKKKVGIYGINALTPSAIKFFKSFPDIASTIQKTPALDKILDGGFANPFGAVFFGALDFVGSLSKKVRESRYTRLPKVAGLGFYGVQSAFDIISIASGNYEDIAKLFFDGSMTYQLGKDTLEEYNTGGKDLWTDITNW